MKTELDFKLVPLDKWVDLYNEAKLVAHMSRDCESAMRDIEKAAAFEVKEEVDYNKEIVEKLTAAIVNGDKNVTWESVEELVSARAIALGVDVPAKADDKKPKRENALAPVEDIIK